MKNVPFENRIGLALLLANRKVLTISQFLNLVGIDPETKEMDKILWETIPVYHMAEYLIQMYDCHMISMEFLLKQTFDLEKKLKMNKNIKKY